MCGAACGVWRCGAFVHKYSYARAYLFIRHVLNSARIACKPRQTASGVFMRLFSMYGYVADIQCVAPFCALIGFFPACGRASFAMRKSPFRVAKETFRRSGKARPACPGCLRRRENASVCGYYTVSGLPPFLFCGFALSKSSKYIYAFSAMRMHPSRGA